MILKFKNEAEFYRTYKRKIVKLTSKGYTYLTDGCICSNEWDLHSDSNALIFIYRDEQNVMVFTPLLEKDLSIRLIKGVVDDDEKPSIRRLIIEKTKQGYLDSSAISRDENAEFKKPNLMPSLPKDIYSSSSSSNIGLMFGTSGESLSATHFQKISSSGYEAMIKYAVNAALQPK